MFAFGIEHEVALLHPNGQFADWTNTTYADLERIIAALPLWADDYPGLHVGDAGIRVKRWYIEGAERFDEAGALVGFAPKGIEIRTSVQPTIVAAVTELRASFRRLRAVARQWGYTPVLVSFNPYQTRFVYDPPLNGYEQQLRHDEVEYRTEDLAMLTYGPDLNLSLRALSPAQVVDVGQKLTYYSPAITPFTYSAPFYAGGAWPGLSARTFHRTGTRPAARVYVAEPTQLIASAPVLTKLARSPNEVGRIEFKACDSCDDFRLYAALLALLKGLALDRTLPGRATTPDAAQHRWSAQWGFNDPDLAARAARLLVVAAQALGDDPDAALLRYLRRRLERRVCAAQALLRQYAATNTIAAALQTTYAPLRPRRCRNLTVPISH